MSDAEGRFEFRTIRPGFYPGGGAPAHIHVIFRTRCCGRQVSETVFDDDPLITKAFRDRQGRRAFRVRQTGGEAGWLAGSGVHDRARDKGNY